MNKQGYRIWEIDERGIPKQIHSTGQTEDYIFDLGDLDLENKTYAIRIGKDGCK